MKISLKVKTGTRQDSLTKIADGVYQVEVRQVPEKGRANQTIIRILSKDLKVPQARIKIVSGLTAKNKIVEIN